MQDRWRYDGIGIGFHGRCTDYHFPNLTSCNREQAKCKCHEIEPPEADANSMQDEQDTMPDSYYRE
jgi:hypothetical protein